MDLMISFTEVLEKCYVWKFEWDIERVVRDLDELVWKKGVWKDRL